MARRWRRCVASSTSRARPATRSSKRYKDCGLEGLTDRSRRPCRQANQLPFQIEKLIVQLRSERPSWGAPKIREKLRRLHSDIPTPAISTVHAVLDRHGLVTRGRKRRYNAQGTILSKPVRPNDLWCADYKGEFMLADKVYSGHIGNGLYRRHRAPRSRPSKHHDRQPDAIERFGQVEQIGDAIGEIERLPLVYPLDGVECEGAQTDHEEAERCERGPAR
jgi:hypothetical protein